MEYLTQYTHIDGTRWVGPTIFADSVEEAMAHAMEYPWQPLEVIGELVGSEEEGEIVRRIVKQVTPTQH
jgi:hypothetical protein